MRMRFVKAASMLVGIALLVVGVVDLLGRRADARADRTQATAAIAHVAAVRTDDLIVATARALRIVSPAATAEELGVGLGLPVCRAGAALACRVDGAAVAAAVQQSGDTTATTVLELGGESRPVIVVAIARPDDALFAVIDVAQLVPDARLVDASTTLASARLRTSLGATPWAIAVPHETVAPGGLDVGSIVPIVGRIGLGAVLVAAAGYGLRREHRGLRRRAETDALTGLPNRAEFERRAATMIERADREGSGACLLMIDLDRFKSINDTFGHASGDRVLADAARRLRSSVRDTDLVARWGGDEFVVLLDGIRDPSSVPARVRAIDAGLRGVTTDDGGELTAAVGAALAPVHGRRLDQLLDVADREMYVAKISRAAGRSPMPIEPASARMSM